METPKDGDTSQRDISLFNKIPMDRSCADAFIEPHWCACLSWQDIPPTNTTVIAAANSFVTFLNAYTEEHRDICHVLKISEIIWSHRLIPTNGILRFQGAGDRDGFIPDLSAKTQQTHDIYQVKVKTEPGGGLFEASIDHDVKKNVFSTKVRNLFILIYFLNYSCNDP